MTSCSRVQKSPLTPNCKHQDSSSSTLVVARLPGASTLEQGAASTGGRNCTDEMTSLAHEFRTEVPLVTYETFVCPLQSARLGQSHLVRGLGLGHGAPHTYDPLTQSNPSYTMSSSTSQPTPRVIVASTDLTTGAPSIIEHHPEPRANPDGSALALAYVSVQPFHPSTFTADAQPSFPAKPEEGPAGISTPPDLGFMHTKGLSAGFIGESIHSQPPSFRTRYVSRTPAEIRFPTGSGLAIALPPHAGLRRPPRRRA